MVERDIVEEARTDENGTGRVKGRKRGYRVRPPLGKLFEDGKIEHRLWAAGERLFADWLTSLGSGDRVASSGGNGAIIGPTQGMIEASERYRKASATIRSEARVVTLRMVCHELTIQQALDLLHMPKCQRTWTGVVRTLQLGLTDLADHYEL